MHKFEKKNPVETLVPTNYPNIFFTPYCEGSSSTASSVCVEVNQPTPGECPGNPSIHGLFTLASS